LFAIDHAATALVVKRLYPYVPMTPVLISTQAMELAWVALNYAGIERTETEPVVRTVSDIHLVYMPYSHSVATALGAAVVVWLGVEKALRKPALGRAMGLAVASHLALDLVTHDRDIALWPGLPHSSLGLGLYASAPPLAFAIELGYGVLCWRIYRGNTGLLWLVVAGNAMNLSLFFGAVPGPEIWLGGHPLGVVTLVLVQIVATLLLVGVLARGGPGGASREPVNAPGSRARDEKRCADPTGP
jgi:hypothetical protein